MYVTVQISSDLPQGTFVCHDANNIWRQATSADNAPLGVLRSDTFLDEQSVRWGEVILSGVCLARAGSITQDQGGWLGCDDAGRATIVAQEECGLVAPVSRGSSLPSVDDLILIHLR